MATAMNPHDQLANSLEHQFEGGGFSKREVSFGEAFFEFFQSFLDLQSHRHDLDSTSQDSGGTDIGR